MYAIRSYYAELKSSGSETLIKKLHFGQFIPTFVMSLPEFGKISGPFGVKSSFVITSYSIHYTKLYET